MKVWFLALFLIPLAVSSKREDVNFKDVVDAVKNGLAEVDSMLALEKELSAKGIKVNSGSSAHLHARMVKSKPSSRKASSNAFKILSASKKLAEKLEWNADEAREKLCSISVKNTDLKNSCPEVITCPDSSQLKYAPVDGSCHNLRNPDWGKSNTPFERILGNAYADGIWESRKASDGSNLQSPRRISRQFIQVDGPDDIDYTLMLMTWGQFITHDLTQASGYTTDEDVVPECCNTATGGNLPPNQLHPFCLPIAIPPNDPFYRPYNQTCMTFVRSKIGPDYSCTLGHAEQLNGNTHWLDASTVYGSDSTTSASLREGQGGLLKASTANGKEMLPVASSCADLSCYYAGDPRAQENPQLAVTHTLFMREHNRIARELGRINQLWDDETIFQEARRIVIAEIQHITYTEYLPLILGSETMDAYQLNGAPLGRYSVYNEDTAQNPSIRNEFAAGAFRVGHSQVKGDLNLYNSNDVLNADQSFTLSDYFNDASRLPDPGYMDNAMRGLTKQVPGTVDEHYTEELTDKLFRYSKPYGFDIVALNIQRGRDHGISDYNSMRVHCGLPKATSFDDLSNEMEPDTLDALRVSYQSVDDIDLYIGCLAEASSPVKESLLGETGLCVIAEQFALTKNSDRFFYEVGGQASSFTIAQLDEIRNTATLARIMCDNNNGDFPSIQPLAFRGASSENAKIPCSNLPSLDLTLWRDRRGP